MEFNPEGKEHLILKDSEVIKKCLHAGKGEFILRAPFGVAHKYAFLAPKNTSEFPEGTIFVYIYHENKRFYLGMMDAGETSFRRTSRSSFGEDTDAVKGARFIVRMANDQALVDRTPMVLYQSGNCCMCGKPLSSHKSFADGMGRKCLIRYDIQSDKVPWDGNTVYD